ncbi:MAG: hypothetical protein Q9179_006319 [Wetmoreana sp. 5 TL-2023]
MHLMYTLDANGKRLYTLKKVAVGEVTKSAHPARFSPDDKYSRNIGKRADGKQRMRRSWGNELSGGIRKPTAFGKTS